MTVPRVQSATRRRGVFSEDHLHHMRPLKISRGNRDERFIFPHLGELKGTSFELCADEVSFATRLLGGTGNHGLRRQNLWVYRTDQKKYAGDFVIVDVSRPPKKMGVLSVPAWDVFVLDLKMNTELQFGGRGGGFQLKDWEKAATAGFYASARASGILPEEGAGLGFWSRVARPACVWRLVGDRQQAVAFFENLRLMRRRRRRHGCDPHALEGYFSALL